jgi:cytochrome c oxidase subunit II
VIPDATRAVAARPRWRRTAPAALTAALVTLTACAPEAVRDSTTDAAAPEAAAIDGLFWFSVLLGTFIWLVVLGLLAVPIVRSRRRRRAGETDPFVVGDGVPPKYDTPAAEADGPLLTAEPHLAEESAADSRARSWLIWVGGIIVPAIVLIVLLVYSAMVGNATAHEADDDQLVIDVIGHMFWWEVHYPDLDITTANEIHVPVDQEVRLQLTTEDVIHSFWIPRLHGKIDMIPGRENLLTFTAEQTGSFRGQCAEFCGIAHAQMVAFVEAMEPGDFDAWVEGQQQDAVSAAETTEGEQAFIDVGCAACHAVDGIDAFGRVGPDLTHLASRETLAAGIVPNTRENLERLIVDPWGLKPGNPMPPTELEDDELAELLDYLEGLE